MIDQVWQDFLVIARKEIGSRAVETWMKAVSISRYDVQSRVVYLQVPNQFVKDWIQRHYSQLLHTHLSRLFAVQVISLCFVLGDNEPDVHLEKQERKKIIPARPVTSHAYDQQRYSAPGMPEKKQVTARPSYSQQRSDASKLNSTYTFDTFVVGENNSFAYAAARAAVENLGRLYNPLFFYGGSGLGKTHLLHAIGNQILQNMPEKVVLYQTTDRFMHEFIHAIRFDKIHNFQMKYRNVDVLLIDDIQFLANKDQTQEVFFHIFNVLYDAHKQIVFSSDTLPRQLGGLVERLKSRLEWGLIADIQVPRLETKIAIIKRKAEIQGEDVSDDAAACIAQYVKTSVRELEGALIRVLAFASLTNSKVTVGLVQKVLGIHAPEQEPEQHTIKFSDVILQVSQEYSYTLSDLRSKNRNKRLSLARQVAMFLMKKTTKKSLREIGDYLGRKDHTTITYAIGKIEKLCKTNFQFNEVVSRMQRALYRS